MHFNKIMVPMISYLFTNLEDKLFDLVNIYKVVKTPYV